MKEELTLWAILAVVFGIPGFFLFWGIGSYQCSSQWKRSGFETSYGPVQGCLISKDGKTWIPADNYREIAD